MSLLQVSELAALVPAPQTTAELQALIDRHEDEIAELIGAVYDGTAISETVAGGGDNIFLKRPISSITTVTEYALLTSSTGTALTAGVEYHAWTKQGRLQRLGGVKWGEKVTVVYVPVDDRAKWKRAVVDLVRLDLSRSGLKEERVGKVEYIGLDNYELERQRILRRLQFNKV